MWGWERGLGDGIRGRLGRLGIGMISKSAKKRRDPYSTPLIILLLRQLLLLKF
jgi:hypothetical protein